MSIATEIQRIQSAKGTIKSAIEAKGVTVPSGATLDTYGTYIRSIETGGSGSDYEQKFIDMIENDITSVTVPNGTTMIGDYAFYYRNKITSITIPDSVTRIGEWAFTHCTRLTSVTIPSTVTKIGHDAFSHCSGLTSITIPDSVNWINANVFYMCTGLTSITIHEGVTNIGNYAFSNCTGLTSITVKATTPPTLGTNVFSSTNDCPIYVPADSVNAYKTATNWSSYASRIQAIPTV